ncbi:MAG TPA: class I SAM-dependent methyltransferase [Candidatus Binataceae bacterium]
MAEERTHRHIGDHDWHSRQYVDDWIARDFSRDTERRPVLERMLAAAPFAADDEIRVLDVGAGYGLVTEVTLARFPRAQVTLLDYSEPMFAHARERLADRCAQIGFIRRDLSESGWTRGLEGAFDLAVSSIAIHNLRDYALIADCYRGIRATLKPGGAFLDCDLVSFSGGLDSHLRWLREAGFAQVECLWQSDPFAILAAFTAARA